MNGDNDMQPWCIPAEQVLSTLRSDARQGLDAAEVRRRRQRYGENRLQEQERRALWRILRDQLANVVVALLAAAAGVAWLFGDVVEALAVAAVIVVNTVIGFATELKAVRSLEALRRLAQVTATVRRAGTLHNVDASELVPGDIVVLSEGDIVSADMRVLSASKLAADESLLTGESLPANKRVEPVAVDAPMADRDSLLFKGTTVARGSGDAVVTHTGTATELGRISKLVAAADIAVTPLEKRLAALGRRLAWMTLVMALVIAATGVLTGRDLQLALQIAIALAVAAIPEGLPVVATIALSRGVWRMARRQALISRLSAVETLGATRVILTDKTGTLTANRMTLTRIEIGDDQVGVSGVGLALRGEFTVGDGAADESLTSRLRDMLTLGALCSNATLQVSDSNSDEARQHDEDGVHAFGDATEIALLVAAAKAGLRREALLTQYEELREEPFDAQRKMMATFNRDGAGVLVAVKGAPEAVLRCCTRQRQADGDVPLDDRGRMAWQRRCDALALEGLRLLAVAGKTAASADGDPYDDLTLHGVVGLLDPPRAGVREALRRCRDAGIDVVMVTGDHLATARSIAAALELTATGADGGAEAGIDASQLGDLKTLTPERQRELLATHIVARATPEQKLDLIALHQQQDRVVAMTGDGVNDAPALKKADIGVAMGRRGTPVAREAAAMVLQDDEFGTIVSAIEQGRAIYANIRKFVVYLLSCNLSEVFVVGLATLAGGPLPLLPLQILFLNLVTDVFPALALGVGDGDPAAMREPPRPASERLLTSRHWLEVTGHAAVLSATVLTALALALLVLKLTPTQAVTISFLTLAFAQLWHVFNMRSQPRRWLRNDITANPWVWAALALCVALVLAAVYVPTLASAMELQAPDRRGWLLVAGMSVVPLVGGPLVRRCAYGRHDRRNPRGG